MTEIVVERLDTVPLERQRGELVERKGLGHPDTMCDLLAEAMSQALCRAYLAEAGRVLHYNIENAFLVAGTSEPAFGGGRAGRPLRFVYGDSATAEVDGRRIPVEEIVEDAGRRWFREWFPHVDPEQHVRFESELRPGSVQLGDLFARERLGSNDTAVGSGYAPLTETERIVLLTEEHVNSPAFKERYPQTGQDVKVSGARIGRALTLVLSLAFVDAEVPDEAAYFASKNEISIELVRFAESHARTIESVDVRINTLDEPGRGVSGVYLTVLGTSADGADGGQIGRGNRPSGVNAFGRPLATAAVAGKNPVANVGKIYNLFAGELARVVHERVEGLEEVHVSLASAIGRPIDEPLAVIVRAVPGGADDEIARLVESELAGIDAFVERLVHDPPRVC